MSRRLTLGVPLVIFLVTWTLTTHGKFSDSGDEPHYLIIAESLWADGDLDLDNNYRDGSARWFGADDLEAGPHARRTRSGALWSSHDIGVPVVLLPVYVIATRAAALVPDALLSGIRQTRGLFAYSLVSLTLILLTTWSAWLLMTAFAREVPAGRAAAVAVAMALSPPVLSHAFLVFPETIAFAVVSAVVWLACQPEAEISTRRVTIIAAVVGLMPWLHRKYAFLVFGLAFLIGVTHRQWFARRPAVWLWGLAALLVVPQAALHLWTLQAWGTIGGPQMLDAVPFEPGGFARGALGLLFDRERGLVGYAPIYLIVPAAFALAWTRSRWLLVPIGALYLPLAAFVTWDAGFSPAARFLVPLTPLVALAVARALDPTVMRRVAIGLCVVQAAITAIVWQNPRTLWPADQATNQALDKLPVIGPAWAAALPSLHTGDSAASGLSLVVVIVIATAGLVVLARRERRRWRQK